MFYNPMSIHATEFKGLHYFNKFSLVSIGTSKKYIILNFIRDHFFLHNWKVGRPSHKYQKFSKNGLNITKHFSKYLEKLSKYLLHFILK